MSERNALLLHGYDARNRGDGELVRLSVAMIRAALGPGTTVVLVALAPETFTGMVDRAVGAVPRSLHGRRLLRRQLRDLDSFDAVFAVGGGYLRAGRPFEALKTIGAHLPQLRAAARTTAPTVYLPQSIGPLLPGTRSLFLRPLRRLDLVCVRDDRSRDLVGARARRLPDLALLTDRPRQPRPIVDATPVLCIRELNGAVPPPVLELSRLMAPHDAFVQSTTRGNDDRAATERLAPRRLLPAERILGEGAPPRVVVSVRLHGALLALQAGHCVIHLAYERKGFGAFDDLGLSSYVHNAYRFDPGAVAAQAAELASEPGQDKYRARLAGADATLAAARAELIDAIRRTVLR